MKLKRVLAALFAVFACAVFATACDNREKAEEHEYVYYKVSDPSCTEKGKVERICIRCGEKDYLDIEALGHNYKDGVCTRCGEEEKFETAHDVSQFYTAEKVYEMAKCYNYNLTSDQFYNNLSSMYVYKIYVNLFGRVKANVNGMDVDLGYVRKDYELQSKIKLTNVVKLWVDNSGCLVTVDSIGTQSVVGSLAALSEDNDRQVVGILINKQNVLIALFSDNKVAPLGIISTNNNDATVSDLVFSGEEVVGPFDRNIVRVIVPVSHEGKSITKIRNGAFYSCNNLKSADLSCTSVLIGANAFANCASLRWVVLPADTEVYYGAFAGCANLTTVFYKGTVTQWENCFIANNNAELAKAAVYCYSENKPAVSGNYWHYVNGEPTVW